MTSEHSKTQPGDEPQGQSTSTGAGEAAPTAPARPAAVGDWEPWPQRSADRGRLNRLAVVTLVLGLLGGVLALVTAGFALRRIRRDGDRGKGLVVAGLVLCGGWLLAGLVAWGVTWTGSAPDTGLRALRVGDCFRVPTGATASRTAPEQVTRVPCDTPHQAEYVDDFPAYERSADERYPGAAVLSQRAEALCRQRQRSYVVDPLGLPAEVRLSWYLPTRVDWSTDPTITCYLTAPEALSRPLRMDGTVLDPAQLGYLLATRDWAETRTALVADAPAAPRPPCGTRSGGPRRRTRTCGSGCAGSPGRSRCGRRWSGCSPRWSRPSRPGGTPTGNPTGASCSRSWRRPGSTPTRPPSWRYARRWDCPPRRASRCGDRRAQPMR